MNIILKEAIGRENGERWFCERDDFEAYVYRSVCMNLNLFGKQPSVFANKELEIGVKIEFDRKFNMSMSIGKIKYGNKNNTERES